MCFWEDSPESLTRRVSRWVGRELSQKQDIHLMAGTGWNHLGKLRGGPAGRNRVRRAEVRQAEAHGESSGQTWDF